MADINEPKRGINAILAILEQINTSFENLKNQYLNTKENSNRLPSEVLQDFEEKIGLILQIIQISKKRVIRVKIDKNAKEKNSEKAKILDDSIKEIQTEIDDKIKSIEKEYKTKLPCKLVENLPFQK